MSQPLPPIPSVDINIIAAQTDALRILSAIEQGQQPNAQLLENFQADLKRLQNDPHVPQNVKHELLRDAKLNPEAFAKLGDAALLKLAGEVNELNSNIGPPVDVAIATAQSGAEVLIHSNLSPSQVANFLNSLTGLPSDPNVPVALQQQIQQALANPNGVSKDEALNIAHQLLNL